MSPDGKPESYIVHIYRRGTGDREARPGAEKPPGLLGTVEDVLAQNTFSFRGFDELMEIMGGLLGDGVIRKK